MSYFYDNQDVRTDMTNVRRILARDNPRGYSLPIIVIFNKHEKVQKDALPLYFASPVVRKQLANVDERNDNAMIVFPGTTTAKAIDITFAYCLGNSLGENWAADLDENMAETAYVWELATALRLKTLERFTREAAFDELTGALNFKTACMLYKKSKQFPALNKKAFLYIARNFDSVVNADGVVEDEAVGSCFPFLTYTEFRDIICAQQLCATEEQRYSAISKWIGSNPFPAKDREAEFYRLVSRLNFSLVRPRRADILEYRSLEADVYEILPCSPHTTRQMGNRVFFAFSLDPLLEKVSIGVIGYKAPRFIGQFKCYEYYWQMEAPWYGKNDTSSASALGMYLRLLHGTDKAGSRAESDVIGVQTCFRLRLHWSKNFDKCYRESECFDVDMMNLPRGDKMHGYRSFLGKKNREQLLKKYKKGLVDAYASVEIVRVRELTERL